MFNAIGNTYQSHQPAMAGAPGSAVPSYMAPVQTIAHRLDDMAMGRTRVGFDPLFDPNSRAYEAYYAYNPKKWLARYAVESTVGTQGGFSNLKKALFGPASSGTGANMPAWLSNAEKSFAQSQKLINFADKNLNSSFVNSVHHNPFANINPTAMTGGVVPTAANQTTTALYGAKALDHDELFALNNTERARIAAIRQQHGWKAALKEAFHGNRVKHAKDVLTQGGRLSGLQGFKNYVQKTLVNREVRWLTEPAKRGEVLASILRPIAMGLFVFDWLKTTKRAHDVARAEGKSETQTWLETAKTFVTKGLKSFATWSIGTISFKAISLAAGVALGLPAIATSIVGILGAVGVGWVFNNLLNKIVPDPPLINE